MTQQNTVISLAFITTIFFSLFLLPWWSFPSAMLIVFIISIWQLRHRIDFLKAQQFIKEFLAFGATIVICSLWAWQLSLWLNQLS